MLPLAHGRHYHVQRMTAQQQLDYEARSRWRQAAIAAAAGILIVAAAIIQLSGPHASVDELTLDLITEAKRQTIDGIGSVVNGLGFFALAWTLNYLYVISRARNPQLQPFIRWLAVLGGVLEGVTAIAYQQVISHKAAEFVSHGAQTYPQAHALTSGGLISALPLVAQLGSLLLTAGLIWLSLSAMRVGLLTRFMGYLGVFAGVLVLFPVFSDVPVVQGFWLVALAYLLTGHWPSGVPAAWRTGRAEPWPSGAELRAQRQGAQGGRGASRTATGARTAAGPESARGKAKAGAGSANAKASGGKRAPGASKGQATGAQPAKEPVAATSSATAGEAAAAARRKRKRRR